MRVNIISISRIAIGFLIRGVIIKSGIAVNKPRRIILLNPISYVFNIKCAPVFSFSGEVYGTCWALWGADTFKWNGLWIGLSLGAFGICQALVQAFLTGPAVKLMGERPTIFAGLACAALALVVMALAKQSWIIFAIMPVFALGGIGTPALQSLVTKQVGKGQQGQFQGVLASVISLSAIIGPLVFSSIYFLVQKEWPGAIWLSNIVIYMIIVPVVLNLRLKKEEPDSINGNG
jgi:MFS transporter, DHA1 family, tetracycline resistance protein